MLRWLALIRCTAPTLYAYFQSSDVAYRRLVVSFCRLDFNTVMRGTITQRQVYLRLPMLYGLRLLIGIKYPR